MTERELFKSIVYKICKKIQDEKVENKKEPSLAIQTEIMLLFGKAVERAVDDLEKDGKVKKGKLLGHMSYTVKILDDESKRKK